MTVVIALKKPSEMTNDVTRNLITSKHFSLSNFTEAMKVTDFWNSLGTVSADHSCDGSACNSDPFHYLDMQLQEIRHIVTL